jgi:hypothetical protein
MWLEIGSEQSVLIPYFQEEVMKNALLVVLFLLLGSSVVLADGVAEVQVINEKPNLDVYVASKIKGDLGWSAFGTMNDSYATMYAGPTWAPKSWIALGANIGVETGGHRFAETLWLGKGRVSALFIEEQGHTGRWYKYTANVAVAKGLTVGLHDQAFIGRGPRMAYTRGKVTVWASLLRHDESFGSVFALKVTN